MKTNSLRVLSVLCAFACSSLAALGVDAKKVEVLVDSTGTAETRDRAVVDACRLAVAKVHGTRVLGHMSNTSAATGKFDQSGNVGDTKFSLKQEGGVYSTVDNTGLSFDGYLLRFEIKKEEKQKNGRWSVQIAATVLGTAPDRFAGKEAVVLPSLERIAKGLSGRAPAESVESMARTLHLWVADTFSNHPNFVILEREREDVLDGELRRSASDNSAVREKSKLKSEKTADIVVEIECEPLVVEHQVIKFDAAPSLNKVQVRLHGAVVLKDVATKGQICRTTFSLQSPKPATAPDSLEAALNKAVSEIEKNLQATLRSVQFDLFSKLGMANIVFGEKGLWVLGGSLDPELLQAGDKISLWRGEGSAATKVAESVLSSDGGRLVFADASIQFAKGEAFAVRLSQASVSSSKFSASTPDATEPPAAPQKSLKDRLKFD
jgi:hypothetical protein